MSISIAYPMILESGFINLIGHLPKKKSVLSQKEQLLFMEQWTRHGSNLRGSFTIKYNQFLVLAVDEDFNAISGCSIDASVHFVQELEKIFNVEMMNKNENFIQRGKSHPHSSNECF